MTSLRLLSILALAALQPAPPSPTVAIKVDQAGYPTEAAKVALVVDDAAGNHFVVRRVPDDTVAFEGTLSPARFDKDSGDHVRQADFTAVTEAGTYAVDVPGTGRSWPFEIGDDVYARPLYLAMRSFYGQRCNTAVDLGEEFPGYRYQACHVNGRFHASAGRDGSLRPSGGWHDAGDYGRYIVNSGLTTGTLLWAWELFGEEVGATRLDIPESDNQIPDILDEIRWNLDWMRSLQDEDGGVWHKQTSEGFPGFVMPQADDTVSYVIGTGAAPWKSTCATADFSAVMAIAARAFRPFDPSYAEASVEASARAWRWAEAHPDVPFRNPQGVSTGAYGDQDCGDERLWAAAELWRTTEGDRYRNYFVEHQPKYRDTLRPAGPQAWPSVGPMAYWTFVMAGDPDEPLLAAIRSDVLSAADALAERTLSHPSRISMTTPDFVWGSNGVAANYSVQLLVANEIRPDSKYVEAALENLHYLLGRNPFSLSWLTGVGANPFRHPHHRPSGADDNAEPWPGLLSGGPNARRQDPAMRLLPDLPPAKMYVDDQESYASNENAINWNAALVFVLAGVQPIDD